MHSPKGDPIFRYHLDSDACGPGAILTELFKQPIVLLEVAGGSCPPSAALLCVLLCIKAASDAAPTARAAVRFFLFFLNKGFINITFLRKNSSSIHLLFLFPPSVATQAQDQDLKRIKSFERWQINVWNITERTENPLNQTTFICKFNVVHLLRFFTTQKWH